MTLTAIGLLTAATLAIWLVARWRPGIRPDLLLVVSVLALYALQPAGSAGLENALPTATLLMVSSVWWLTMRPAPSASGESTGHGRTLIVIGLCALLVPIARAITNTDRSLTGDILRQVISIPLAAAAVVVGTVALGTVLPATPVTADTGTASADIEATRRRLALGFVVLIVVCFVVIKLPALQYAFGRAWLGTVKSAASNIPFSWQWLGFSYVAFRLLHVLLDYRNNRLKSVSLRDFALYVVFYPALPAGPIDRVEHFARELQQLGPLDSARLVGGVRRIATGLFKKFVLADSLAYFALNSTLVAQVGGPNRVVSLWLMVYAYAFQIYFDFSGYTDVALGIAQLAGIMLPENFSAPYGKRNITAFWNSWHITLSTWFRNYFFTPLSRALMQSPLKERRLIIVLVAQVGTMVLIGLWHGIAINFVLWGVWHGVGLWFNRWLVDHTRGWTERVQTQPRLAQTIQVLSVLATFHFVAVGWVFFALADLNLIGKTLAGLVGIGG